MASVLVVDDQADGRDLLTTIVGAADHTVLAASSGAAALAIARQERPDLIITDIVMPMMDGYEFARLLRSDPALAATPVVFCTASQLEDVEPLAVGCGVERFLIKPCEPEQILTVVQDALANAQAAPGALLASEQMRAANSMLVAKVGELEAQNARVREALRLSEVEFRLLFDHNPQPMMVYERSTLAIVAVNNVLAERYGYSKDELLAMRLTDILPPDDAELLGAFFDATPDSSTVRFSTGYAGRTWRHRHKDGALIDVEVASDDLLVAGVACRIAVFNDVTERNRAAAERTQMADELAAELMSQNERLRDASQLKDQFVSVVSHELRTPLTAIRGYLEILLGEEPGPLTAEQGRCLEIVGVSCTQLLRVVGDLLLIGKSEDGQLVLDIGELDPTALVEECVAAAMPAADAKQIGLRMDGEEGLAAIPGDSGRLSQAIGNVISNAIKFTDHGHVEVGLHSELDRVLIDIADTGSGVPASEVEHLFVPFFRASHATRQAIPGSGLGLSIAKEIIEAHGGTIALASEPGSGTSVHVELPMALAR
jgi:PAS domain S-box-containing protein